MEEESKKLPENSNPRKIQDEPQLQIQVSEEKEIKIIKEEKPSFIDSEEELLGSVSTPDCPGVRTSARFIQKQKDSQRPATPPLNQTGNSEKESGNNTKNKDEKSVHPKTPSQGAKVKVVWTNVERSLFFDALNEFGKDFDAIANFINFKLKRQKSDITCKTKEQIRATYYTTFHKISKFIKFSEEVKKPVQELYALINYGEMRRKLQFISEKNCMKIRELVYQGHVTFRHKGKNIRIRTPPCKALRKLNQIEDWLEDIKLPPKVDICLRPINMEAFGRVQSVAQNPYVRTSVPLQKKVVNIIKTFQTKWRTQESRMINESNKLKSSTSNDVSSKENISNEAMLHLRPHADCKIHRPLVNITQFLSSLNICLNSYENRIGVKVKSETIINDLRINNTAKRSRCDSSSEKKSPESKKIRTDLVQDLTPELPFLSPPSTSQTSGADASESDEINDELQDFLEDSIRTITACTKIAPPPAVAKKSKLKKQPRSIDLNTVRPLISDEIVNKIRKGWTILNAADITIGDLYCVFGQDSKLIFEYSWIDPPETNICDNISSSTTSSVLGNKLKHLLMIANLHEQQRTSRLKKTNCFCGHICDKSTILNNKTYIATKVLDNDQRPNGKTLMKSPNAVFRQPMLPFRRPTFGVEGLKRMTSPRLKGRQVVVQRILPLHPDQEKQETVTGIGVTPINNNLVSTEIGTTFSLPPVIEISSPSALSIPSFSDENSNSDIIPMSPSNILRDVDTADPRWMDEYSMSSLLGHLDELANTSDTCNTPARSNESSSLSIISETSVDYVTKFAELAAAEENGGL